MQALKTNWFLVRLWILLYLNGKQRFYVKKNTRKTQFGLSCSAKYINFSYSLDVSRLTEAKLLFCVLGDWH